MASAVSDLLKDAGMITTIPELDYEHGWEFDAAQDGRKYWLLVTDLADRKMLIYTEDLAPLAFVWQEGPLREVSQQFAPIVIPGQKIHVGEMVRLIYAVTVHDNAKIAVHGFTG